MRPVLAAALALGALAGCGGGDAGVPDGPPAAERPSSARAAAPAGPARAAPAVVLVRRRGGVPSSWLARLRRAPGVAALAEVARTQLLLRRSQRRDGRLVQAAPAGHAVPLDALVVAPRAYARVTAAPAALDRLRPGSVLLPRASAALRRLGAGDRLVLAGGRSARVAAVVADEEARGAEVVVPAADVPRAERRNPQVLVATTAPRRVRRAVPVDAATRVAPLGDRGPRGGSIVRPLAVKRAFGEFAVRLPYGEDWIGIDPAWVRRTIVTREVPLLGAVTCHRATIGPLRRALGALARRGLGRLVDPGDFAGCHAPRRIPGSGSLSLHAWGLAVDLNASANPVGPRSRQDPRLVRALEAEGFTWGGRWPTAPDPMHFELQTRPDRG